MWIFDSGATSHMTNNPDGLYNISDCLESVEYGKSESGSISKIKGYLDVKIRNSDGTVNDMTLTDVLYIEDLNCNVISVFQQERRVSNLENHQMDLHYLKESSSLKPMLN